MCCAPPPSAALLSPRPYPCPPRHRSHSSHYIRDAPLPTLLPPNRLTAIFSSAASCTRCAAHLPSVDSSALPPPPQLVDCDGLLSAAEQSLHSIFSCHLSAASLASFLPQPFPSSASLPPMSKKSRESAPLASALLPPPSSLLLPPPLSDVSLLFPRVSAQSRSVCGSARGVCRRSPIPTALRSLIRTSRRRLLTPPPPPSSSPSSSSPPSVDYYGVITPRGQRQQRRVVRGGVGRVARQEGVLPQGLHVQAQAANPAHSSDRGAPSTPLSPWRRPRPSPHRWPHPPPSSPHPPPHLLPSPPP